MRNFWFLIQIMALLKRGDTVYGRLFALRLLALPILLLGANAIAQVPGQDWEFENGYDDDMLYLHALVNYSHDLHWQLEWERRLLADNGLRLNVGSVSATELLTIVDLNVNHDLNAKWRFQGRAYRNETKHRPNRDDQFFLGLERSILESSAVFLMATPQYSKEFMDIYAGYTFYRQDRQQYVRVGILLKDMLYDTKNELDGQYEQQPVALQWAVRLGTEDWWIFSEGTMGTGFERLFPDADTSPDLSRHDRRENFARFRFTMVGRSNNAWSTWVDWYDFSETKLFRQPGFDYEYMNTQLNFAAEYVQTLRDRHRLRFLAHYVRQDAGSRGFNEHDHERTDVLGGAFYEYLWPMSGLTFAYEFGLPNVQYQSLDDSRNFSRDDYRDKLILGWRYNFSLDAQIFFSLSHEISTQGFGGGNLQFQMFF